MAAHQRNAPWDAYDWGTKRWASYDGVCAGVAARRLLHRSVVAPARVTIDTELDATFTATARMARP